MERTFPIDVETSFRAELLCKDLVSWLELAPEANAGNPKFTTVDEWESWWENQGPDYRRRATQSFTELAEARVDAGLTPEGQAIDELDEPD